jgi:hypothetical protein
MMGAALAGASFCSIGQYDPATLNLIAAGVPNTYNRFEPQRWGRRRPGCPRHRLSLHMLHTNIVVMTNC